MAGGDAFRIEGRVVEALPNGTYRVELSNGHRLLGFVTGVLRRSQRRFAPGETVGLRLSPCDLSRGHIVAGEEKQFENEGAAKGGSV